MKTGRRKCRVCSRALPESKLNAAVRVPHAPEQDRRDFSLTWWTAAPPIPELSKEKVKEY